MDRPSAPGSGAVLVVDSARGWPRDLLDEVSRQGFLVWHIDGTRRLPLYLVSGEVRAVLVQARSLDVTDVLSLRQCREHAPRTSVIVVSPLRTHAEVKRALDSGATAFLSLPASPLQVRDALLSGEGGGDWTT